MAFQSVDRTAEVVVDWATNSGVAANVLHFQRLSGYSETQLQELADIVDDAIDNCLLAVISVAWTYIRTRVRGLQDENDIAVSQDAGSGVGAQAASSLPDNVAYVLTLRSGLTGRSARGRIYIGGLYQAALTASSVVSTTYRDAVVACIEALIVAADAAGWTMVIVSRVTGGAPRAEGVTFPVTTVEGRNLRTDSMRGRLQEGH